MRTTTNKFGAGLVALALIGCSSNPTPKSSFLERVVGSDTYAQAGLNELSPEQLSVLERWVVGNVPNARELVEPAVDEAVANTPTMPKARPPAAVTGDPAVVTPTRPAPPTTATAAPEVTTPEVPTTQKYVLIDTVEQRNQAEIEPDLITTHIKGKFTGWRNNKTRFYMINGDVWEQRQSGTYITNLESPEVIIRKHRFGYTMEVPAVNKKVHVKRIK